MDVLFSMQTPRPMLFAGILGCLAITAGCKSKKSVIAGLVDRPANSLNTVAAPETTPSVADAPPAPLPTVSPKPDVVTSITIYKIITITTIKGVIT